MKSWSTREARAKFCELVRLTLKEGPQVISRRGKEEVVFVSIEEWRRTENARSRKLKELLLDDGPRFELGVPDRKNSRLQKRPAKFD